MTSRLVLFFLFAFLPGFGAGSIWGQMGWSDASAGWPLIDNLGMGEPALAGPTWAIARTADGEILAGAQGMLAFDGHRWREVPVPGGHTFRGVAADREGRIWIGGVDELGFLQRDAAGAWVFTSLRAEALRAGARAGAEIWHVALTPDGVVYVATDQILRWRAGRFECWDLEATPRLFAHETASGLLIHQPGVGLLSLGTSGPEIVYPESELPPGLILWLVETDVGLVVGTNEAAYRLRSGGHERLARLSEILTGCLPTSAVALDSRTLAIGTYRRGLLIADLDGRLWRVVDRAAGLADDRINRLTRDPAGGLWLGLSFGLARLEERGRDSWYDSRNGFSDGPVRRVLRADDEMWVVTSRRLLKRRDSASPGGVASLEPEPGLDTFIWDARLLDGEMFVGGFGGIWRRGADGWVHEHHVSADVFRLAPSRRLPATLFFLEGRSVRMLQRTPNGWVPRTLMEEMGDTPFDLLEDAAGDLWASTLQGNVHRFRVARTAGGVPTFAQIQSFAAGRGLPSAALRPRLSLAGDRVVAFTSTGILWYDQAVRRFAPVPGFEPFIGLAAAGAGDAVYWAVRHRDFETLAVPALFRIRTPATGDWAAEPVASPASGWPSPLTSLDWIAGRDGRSTARLWLGGAERLLRIAPDEAPPLPPVAQLWPMPGAEEGRKAFGFLGGGETAVSYQWRLTGASEVPWSGPQRETAQTLSGLAPGAYAFEVRAIDRWGRTGPVARSSFVLPTPWYRRGVAIAGYAIAGVGLLAGAAWWRVRRLERHAAELNRLVEQRTQQLAQADAAKGEFLENISHEIRNPLNGIIGLVAMLREAALGPRERDLAQSLAACARALTRVFDEVLNFTRLEHGQVQVHDKPFSLAALADEVVALFHVTARQRGAELVVRRDGAALDRFVGDEEKIKAILENFAANALKYAPGSPVEIGIQCAEPEGPSVEVTFTVTDRGPGIPPDEQEMIFEKFVRGAQAKSQRSAGTGLGLAACRALAGLLGGHVGVESEPGRGATFFLTLRLVRDGAPETVAASPAHATEHATRRALVVEDQPYNQIVMRRLAEKLGYAVEIAHDAGDALHKLRLQRFAVVFIDWELPDLKGGEVARQVRAQPAGGDEPILIATTAHDSEAIRRECLAAGMDEFALKPFELETIARLIDDVRARRARADHPEAAGLDLRVFDFVGYDDPQQAAQAAALYLETLDRELAAMASACAGDDTASAIRTAHRLKAHAGLVGAVALREAADRFQRHATELMPEERMALGREVGRQGALLRARLSATPSVRASG